MHIKVAWCVQINQRPNDIMLSLCRRIKWLLLNLKHVYAMKMALGVCVRAFDTFSDMIFESLGEFRGVTQISTE